MKIRLGIALFAPLLALVSLSYAFSGQQSDYGTWQSLEPDAWASTWLILTHIDPDAEITIRPAGSELSARTPFAVPGSRFVRDNHASAFEKLLSRIPGPDPSLARMGKIIHAIESATWGGDNSEAAIVVEEYYRTLQSRFDRHYVPTTCYGQFFDVLHGSIKVGDNPDQMARKLGVALQATDSDCEWGRENGAARQVVTKEKDRVGTVPVRDILDDIAAGQDVVFVDTRESSEYQENHIPGAINIKLREVNETSLERLKGADLVVSYCLKDFRGYEVARKLMRGGVEHSSVMEPHGLVGWQSLGLPVWSGGEPETQAVAQLVRCANGANECIKAGRQP